MNSACNQRVCQCLLLMGVLVTGGAAQEPDPTGITVTPGPVGAAADPETQRAVERLLEEATDAFRKAPAIMTTTTVEINSGAMQNDLEVEAWFGPDGAIRVKSPDSEIVVTDGILNVVLNKVADRYIRIPVSQFASDDIETLFGNKFAAGYEILMREGQPWPVWLEALLMRSVGVPTITGLEDVTGPEGQPLKRMSFTGAYGTGTVDYDPSRKIILNAAASMRPMEGLESFSWRMRMTCSVQFPAALPSPITFSPGNRVPVATRAELDPVARNVVKVGQSAPPLQLSTRRGSTFDLQSHRGKTVILCFWSTRGTLSIKALDILEELFEAWGRNEEDVLIYGVDVREGATSRTEAVEIADRFWSQNMLEIPTMVTVGDDVVRTWGILSVPMTVLVGPDGTVTHVERGVGVRTKMNLENQLKGVSVSRKGKGK